MIQRPPERPNPSPDRIRVGAEGLHLVLPERRPPRSARGSRLRSTELRGRGAGRGNSSVVQGSSGKSQTREHREELLVNPYQVVSPPALRW